MWRLLYWGIFVRRIKMRNYNHRYKSKDNGEEKSSNGFDHVSLKPIIFWGLLGIIFGLLSIIFHSR